MIVEIEVYSQGNGIYTDTKGRSAHRKSDEIKTIDINTDHVIAVEPLTARLVETLDPQKPTPLCRVRTIGASYTVVGERAEISKKLIGKELLRG